MPRKGGKPTPKQLEALEEKGRKTRFQAGGERAAIMGRRGRQKQLTMEAVRKECAADMMALLLSPVPPAFKPKLLANFGKFAEEDPTVWKQICAAIGARAMNGDRDAVKTLVDFLELIKPPELNVTMPPTAPQIIFDIPKPPDAEEPRQP